MEIFDPLIDHSIDRGLTGPERMEQLSRALEFEMQSSEFLTNRGPIALKFLIMGAMFSWQNGGRQLKTDSIFFRDSDQGRLEIFQLMKKGAEWQLRSLIFTTDADQALFADNEVNMNSLVDHLMLRAGLPRLAIRKMIANTLRSCNFLSFDSATNSMNTGTLSLTLTPNSDNDLGGRVFIGMYPLEQYLSFENFNQYFTGDVEGLVHFKHVLQGYFDYFRHPYPDVNHQNENFLDFVHGVLLNLQQKFSLRIHRPGIQGNLAIATREPLVEHFAPLLYLHQDRGMGTEPTIFNIPGSWKTYQQKCSYIKIRQHEGTLEVFNARSLPAVKPTIINSPMSKFAALFSKSDVYWPETVLGELIVRRNYDRALGKQFFKPLTKPVGPVARRFSFAYGTPEGAGILLNVIEYKESTPFRQQTTVPDFLSGRNYLVYDLHVLTPSIAQEALVDRQVLQFSRIGYSANFPDERMQICPLENLLDIDFNGDIVGALFTNPSTTVIGMYTIVQRIWPYEHWSPERMDSLLKGMFSSDLGVHYNDDFLRTQSAMYIYKTDTVHKGVVLKVAGKSGPAARKPKVKELTERVRKQVDKSKLSRTLAEPVIIILSIFKGVSLSVLFDSTRHQCSTNNRRKRAIICEYDEPPEEEPFDDFSDLEQVRLLQKFKNLDELEYAYEKENFRKTYSSKSFEKATKWSNTLMLLQMGKNTLGSMIEGDWGEVAFNAGFLLGSGALSVYGERVSETGREIVRNLGRTKLAKAMLIGGPLMSRLPSALIAFDLYNQWQNYKNGHDGAIVGVIGDSVAVANEAISVVLEITAAEVCWPAAPIGALIFLGLDVYNSVRSVSRMNDLVHLTIFEKIGEFGRAFMGISPKKYIQDLVDEKNMNDRNMDEFADRFRCSKDVAFYSQPSQRMKSKCSENCILSIADWPGPPKVCGPEKCQHEVSSILDNIADFRRKQTMFSRAFPKKIDNFELQCSNATIHRKSDEDESWNMFQCSNMMSIKINNSHSEISMIEIGNGNDTIYGFEENYNVIRMSDGHKTILGGNKADSFILYGSKSITGIIDGSDGYDELNLQSYQIKANLMIKPINNHTDLQMTSNYPGYGNNEVLQLKNIEKITGREGWQDIVHVGCNVQEIDLKGGDWGSEDQIIIDGDCFQKLSILIEGAFSIANRAKRGNFHYVVKSADKQQTIHLATDGDVTNLISFNYSLTDVKEVMHIQQVNHSQVDTSQGRVLGFWFPPSDEGTERHTWVSFASDHTIMRFTFSDNITVIHRESQLIGYKEVHDGDIDDLIARYASVANTHHIHLVINIRNKVNIVMGHGSYKNFTTAQILNNETSTMPPVNVMTNDVNVESHLVCGNTENLFLIRANTSKMFSHSMKPTIIHYYPGMKNSTIDLTDLALKHKNSAAELTMKVMLSDHDEATLILGTRISEEKEHLFGVIKLKNFSSSVLRELVTIKTDLNVLWIDVEKQILKPKPVHYTNATKVIILMADDNVDHLIIDHNINQTSYIKCNESLTMISSIASIEDYGETEFVTVTLLNYFSAMKSQRKMFNDLRFDFINQSFTLNDELQSSINLYNTC